MHGVARRIPPPRPPPAPPHPSPHKGCEEALSAKQAQPLQTPSRGRTHPTAHHQQRLAPCERLLDSLSVLGLGGTACRIFSDPQPPVLEQGGHALAGKAGLKGGRLQEGVGRVAKGNGEGCTRGWGRCKGVGDGVGMGLARPGLAGSHRVRESRHVRHARQRRGSIRVAYPLPPSRRPPPASARLLLALRFSRLVTFRIGPLAVYFWPSGSAPCRLFLALRIGPCRLFLAVQPGLCVALTCSCSCARSDSMERSSESIFSFGM